MIAKLRELLAAATPGPWRKDGYKDIWSGTDRETRQFLGAMACACETCETNAALIVAAVNALPALLAVAEAAQNTVGQWEDCYGEADPDVLFYNLGEALDALEVKQ